MIKLVIALLAILFTCSYAQAAIYVTGKPLDSGDEDPRYSQLPAYLRYPNDALSVFLFKEKMKEVINESCNYRFMLYTDTAEFTPVIDKQMPPLDVNEIHYYFKDGVKAWYSISTMKHESVRTNSVRSWVERADNLSFMIGAYDIALRVPESFKGQEFRNVNAYDMGEEVLYNELHGFDESHLYARIFYLGEQVYKKFILVAKKDDWSWRVEVNIPSTSEEILPPDFVPAGQTFGKFYPVN